MAVLSAQQLLIAPSNDASYTAMADGLLLTDQHDKPRATCDAGVEKVPLKHGVSRKVRVVT
jgi:hypothetical protein